MELADKASFRDAMAHVGAAVNIITTDGPAGRAGFTASAVCSVTDTPPTLLVCLEPLGLGVAGVQRTPHAVRQYPGGRTGGPVDAVWR